MSTPSLSDRLAELADVHDIIQVLYRYAAAVDRLDADRLAACFHDDATDDHGIFDGPVAEFVPWVMDHVGAWVSTQHDITNPIVEIRGDEAVSECHWIGWYRLRDGDRGTDQLHCGRYLDRFERRAGEWRIAHRTCVTDWSRPLGPVDLPRPHRLSGRRGRDDLSAHLWDLGPGFRLPAAE